MKTTQEMIEGAWERMRKKHWDENLRHRPYPPHDTRLILEAVDAMILERLTEFRDNGGRDG